jgi:hypothetical protein
MRLIRLLTTLALLGGLAWPAQAQNAPEWPGLRNLTQLRLYIFFVGRQEAFTACGITPEFEAGLFDAVRALPDAAGLRVVTRQFERQQPRPGTDTHVLMGMPRDVAMPSLGLSIIVLSSNIGGQQVCTLSTDMTVRAMATGSNITATGMVLDGPLQLWHGDETDMTLARNVPAELRQSVEDGMRGLVREWTIANGRTPAPAAAPGGLAPTPPPAPPAGGPRQGGAK